MNEPYFIQTRRLGFRLWRQDDFDLAYGLWGDFEVTRLIDARGKLSEGQVQERLAQEIARQEAYGLQYWPIFLLDSGEHVGCSGLRPYDLPQQIYEIGFHIRSKHWRCGFAQEAACATIDYAFNQIKAAGLFAGHNPQNEASAHLLRKLGFQYTHDEYYQPTGLQHPSYLLRPGEEACGNGRIQKALDTDRTIDIITTGRHSGKPRRTEIWFHRLEGRTYITGTPGKRDWYANLQANPHFIFHLKESITADLPARARFILDEKERQAILAAPQMAWYHGQVKSLSDLVQGSPLIEVVFEE